MNALTVRIVIVFCLLIGARIGAVVGQVPTREHNDKTHESRETVDPAEFALVFEAQPSAVIGGRGICCQGTNVFIHESGRTNRLVGQQKEIRQALKRLAESGFFSLSTNSIQRGMDDANRKQAPPWADDSTATFQWTPVFHGTTQTIFAVWGPRTNAITFYEPKRMVSLYPEVEELKRFQGCVEIVEELFRRLHPE